MAAKYVSTDKVKAARASLRTLARRKPPTIRTEHYATFLSNLSEIERLLDRGAVWAEIQQRYFRKAEKPPTIRSLQRYYVAALEQRGKR